MTGVGRSLPAFAMTPKALLVDPSISCTAKSLFAVLWTFTDGNNDDRFAFPKQDVLCGMMGVSTPVLRDSIRELVALGWISVKRESTLDNGKRNIYLLHMEQVPLLDSLKESLHDISLKDSLHENVQNSCKESLHVSTRININNHISKLEGNSAFEEWFESFKKAYPKRENNPWSTARKSAAKLWLRKPKDKPDLEMVLAKVAQYAEYCRATDSLVAQAATWLNQERWDCDYSVRSKTGKVRRTITDEEREEMR